MPDSLGNWPYRNLSDFLSELKPFRKNRMLDLSNVSKVSSEPFEFGPIQTKWLEALESGKYKQGGGRLRNDTPDGSLHCCLGVLCEVMELPFNNDAMAGMLGYSHAGTVSNGYLPTNAMGGLISLRGDFRHTVKLERGDCGDLTFSCLAHMNDSGAARLSFAEIAQYIRHDPHNVFRAAA